MEPSEQIQQWLAQAESMPQSDSRLAILEQAMKMAQLHQIPALEFEVKLSFSKTAIEIGSQEKMLVHFPWLLAYADEHPEVAGRQSLFWLNTWAILTAIDFPQISKQDIESASIDLEDRLVRGNISRARILQDQIILQILIGNIEKAEAAYEEMVEFYPLPTSTLALEIESHRISTVYSLGYFLIYQNRWEDAREVLRPLLEYRKSAGEWQRIAKSLMLMPLATFGEVELAAEYHRDCLRETEMEADELACYGDYIAFYTVTGDWLKGLELFEKMAPFAVKSRHGVSFLVWLRGIIHLFKRISEAHRDSIALRLPPKHPLYQESGHYRAVDLLKYYQTLRNKLLGDFDRRNGNSFLSDYHALWDAKAAAIQVKA